MPDLMDLFAECDACGGRDFEELGSELICIECGMAFVVVSPTATAAVSAAEPVEQSEGEESGAARAA
jgi:hypothetical protein